MTNKLENPILMAKIGAPHGVRGEVRIKSFTDDPLAFADYQPLHDKAGRVFKVSSTRHQKNMIVTRLDGVSSREQAEALNGTELYVDRGQLPDIEEEDEFYLSDLIGMKLIDAEGSEIGVVRDIPNYGAGDLVEFTSAGQKGTQFLPFTSEIFPQINLEAGTIEIVFPQFVSERDEEEDDT